ncbi:MAG: CDP-alcohol phosphatidyltransferase [Desulfobacula sp.]|jgi:phosphatidylserine synthase|uniref:CDP-alcohol phosphatidyltransferase family protein n=1 Tax=Desulfobacula sp. TaxID=2593537 RepID=UPI001DA3822B|nr:CDP-alcohol phosphatidyltransferase [Desulfobacula sp.]MBT3487146.1 CDP-alcohol phosphatidyltransferase [Desulfobacula sp.]MBT3807600.1 CDP-alcohol phosphatidyltransferase [Desulfobacula sp.]MBT4026884.1 CDP-alcohol phosphatidyltransferase [Desulfobacula sp.]MBT4199543.1 CDP-alcohol phosphatidyltransferase [Desulfobacula sp.]
MSTSQSKPSHQIGMLWFAKDLPNLCSLAGLLCALLGVYFAVIENFPAAVIGMIWAVLFDWGDGIIARKIKGRTDEQKNFGAQLDSLIDMISFGICPAVFLLSYGNFSAWFLPGAFVIVATSAIRLSYFNLFGLVDSATYKGLALDNNIIVFAFVFLFEFFFAPAVFSIILYTMFIAMAGLNLSPLRTPKFSGKWFYALIVYTVILTIIYCWILST